MAVLSLYVKNNYTKKKREREKDGRRIKWLFYYNIRPNGLIYFFNYNKFTDKTII